MDGAQQRKPDRLVVRNALANGAWLELRMADLLRQDEYTAETLRDLAEFLERGEALLSVDRFTAAILAWLRGR